MSAAALRFDGRNWRRKSLQTQTISRSSRHPTQVTTERIANIIHTYPGSRQKIDDDDKKYPVQSINCELM